MKFNELSTLQESCAIGSKNKVNSKVNFKKHAMCLFLKVTCGGFQRYGCFAMMFTLAGKPENARSGVAKGSQKMITAASSAPWL